MLRRLCRLLRILKGSLMRLMFMIGLFIMLVLLLSVRWVSCLLRIRMLWNMIVVVRMLTCRLMLLSAWVRMLWIVRLLP